LTLIQSFIMKKIKNSLRLIIVLIPIALLFQSCEKTPKVSEGKEKYIIPDSIVHALVIDTVSNCPLLNALTLTAIVDFNQDKQVNVFPLVSGIVQDVKVQLGDFVSVGQVLAVVKSSEMASYSNNLIVAQTNVTATKKQLDALQDLYKSGFASVLDVTSAQVNYDQAVSQLNMAKRVLKINGSDTLGNYVIKASISGFIVQKNITNNMAIRSDNNTNLFTISDLKDVWIQANVYETNIDEVHLGDNVEVRILSNAQKVYTGKVDKILNALDPVSKVVKVRIILPNPDYALKPQMYASVTVLDPGNRQALCVSAKALVYEQSQYFVVVYHGKGDAEIRKVEVLNTLGDKTYIKSGVKVGERIIASQALQMYSELNN